MNESTTPLCWGHPGFAGRVGVARCEVTPPLEIFARNWGAAAHDRASRVHRPLLLTAVVFAHRQDDSQVVLLEGDLSWWYDLPSWHWFQQQLLGRLKLRPEQLWFSVTHTHASPPLTREVVDGEGGELLPQWLDDLLEHSVRLVEQARGALQPAVLQWETGTCHLAAVRDLPLPDEPGRVACGFWPEGRPDSTLLVGRVCTESGVPLAVIVNYACHPTTLAFENVTLSPDFIGAMRQVVEAELPGALAVFLQGASGELAPRYQYTGDPRVADRHGRQLGWAVLSTLQGMEPPGTELVFRGVQPSGAPLALWRHRPGRFDTALAARRGQVELELKSQSPVEELEAAYRACQDRTERERLRRRIRQARSVGTSGRWPLPIWTWRLGDSLWVGTMAEPYSRFQQQLRQAFAPRPVVCVNLLNGTVGYLPPAETYQLDIYQAWQSPFAPGCLEKTIQAARDELEQLVTESE